MAIPLYHKVGVYLYIRYVPGIFGTDFWNSSVTKENLKALRRWHIFFKSFPEKK